MWTPEMKWFHCEPLSSNNKSDFEFFKCYTALGCRRVNRKEVWTFKRSFSWQVNDHNRPLSAKYKCATTKNKKGRCVTVKMLVCNFVILKCTSMANKCIHLQDWSHILKSWVSSLPFLHYACSLSHSPWHRNLFWLSRTRVEVSREMYFKEIGRTIIYFHEVII